MKLFSIIILLLLTQSCFKDKNSNPCGAQTYNYQTLDITSKSKVPYLKKQFDTISYASNKGDTLVFVRQAKDSSWYCKDYYSNKDCLPNYNCYETYGAKYTCIKGNGSFEFKHGEELFIEVNSNTRPDNDYYNMIEFHFNNNLHVIFCDCVVGDKKYIGDTIINNVIFKNVFYEFHEFDNYYIGKGYYCEEFGLFHIQDKVNNTNWTLIKP